MSIDIELTNCVGNVVLYYTNDRNTAMKRNFNDKNIILPSS